MVYASMSITISPVSSETQEIFSAFTFPGVLRHCAMGWNYSDTFYDSAQKRSAYQQDIETVRMVHRRLFLLHCIFYITL